MKNDDLLKFSTTEFNATEITEVTGGGKVSYWIGYGWGYVSGFIDDFVESQAEYSDYGPKC